MDENHAEVGPGEQGSAPPTPPQWRLTPKRLGFGALAALLIISAGLYGRHWWTDGRFLESTDDAYVGGDVTTMAAKVAGYVTRVEVVDNQPVRAGDLLVQIDDRDYRAALAHAEAAVAAQQATLLNLDATRELQEAVIAQARAEIAATEAETTRTRFDYTRYKLLADNQFASQQRFQQADADYRKASAATDKARATLTAAERELNVIGTRKQQVSAALDQARADREIATLNLGHTEIRAPIDGTVGNRSARAGFYATPGAHLVAIVPARGLWVDANFKESQLGAMRPGQRASVVADVLPGETFAGEVESLAPATGAQFSVLPPENATGNFTKIVQRVPVRIRLDGSGGVLGRLRPGLSVTATVDRREPQPGHALAHAEQRTAVGKVLR